MLLNIICGLAAVICTLISLFLAQRIIGLQQQIKQLTSYKPLWTGAYQNPVLPDPEFPGCRVVGLCIEQDHRLPTLATLIMEGLLREGVQTIVIDKAKAEELLATEQWPGLPSAIIVGSVKCNDYTDTYVSADLIIRLAGGESSSMSERPPQNARQVNLTLSILAKLKQLSKTAEVSAAHRELNA